MIINILLNTIFESAISHSSEKRKHPDKMLLGDVVCVENDLFDRYGIWDGENIILYGKVKGGSKVVHEESLRRFMHGAETLRICIFPKKYGQPLQQEISSPITSVVMPPEKIWRFMEQSRKAALYKRYSPLETIQRARSKLGKGGYLSSEHFAMWCKTGISESHQLNNMIEIMDRIIVY